MGYVHIRTVVVMGRVGAGGRFLVLELDITDHVEDSSRDSVRMFYSDGSKTHHAPFCLYSSCIVLVVH